MILKLEDQAFHCILKYFDNLLDNPRFKAQLVEMPLFVRERIFSGLNCFYGKLSNKILKIFSTESLALSNINVTLIDGDEKEILKFLQTHKFKKLKVKHANIFSELSLLEEIDEENLELLQIQIFENRFYFPCYFGLLSPNKDKLLQSSSPFKNLRTLHISGLKTRDQDFFKIMKCINTIEDIDISKTTIRDIRPLKYQKNLKYLDCSELYWIAGGNYIHLQCLENLKYLRFGNIETHTPYLRLGWSNNISIPSGIVLSEDEKEDYLNVPERFLSKNSWSITNFLKMTLWEDLEFFDLVGNWRPTRSSVL